ncbi:hypothetical protein BO71DRAFT_478951 [Aspergillus ellipticus CBS 707.79]|uniref:Zincin n=1 Tax=Aspergillus ellipticus CBS 707.79 TaxID=1448320 RepID=A0A319EH22_9EURO|nr:hypothetical protein BO71DRAFT_478951 [Aspergillus ellipticus CBS 707.79]
MEEWMKSKKTKAHSPTETPQVQDVISYLSAFYHGLPVRILPSALRFVPWDQTKKSTARSTPRYVGLAIGNECVGIRTRASPDKVYPRQLNLDDLLDATIGMLPKDAYALCFLVDHDLFEDADDIFVCGRAYGVSRVAVLSSARYCPDLDAIQAALTAISTLPTPDPSVTATEMSALWLARMCRTASHELGHCFGVDHCVYHACIMQGSASLSEDARQPPYLCPVDLSKILHATGSSASSHYHAMLAFCEQPHVKEAPFFRAFAAWIHAILAQMSNSSH